MIDNKLIQSLRAVPSDILDHFIEACLLSGLVKHGTIGIPISKALGWFSNHAKKPITLDALLYLLRARGFNVVHVNALMNQEEPFIRIDLV